MADEYTQEQLVMRDFLRKCAREWQLLNEENPGRGSPFRAAGNRSQQTPIEKDPTLSEDYLIERTVLQTGDTGGLASEWGSLVLDATAMPTDRGGYSLVGQGWSRLRAKINWGVGGLSQTIFCDWNNIVQVPINNLTVTALYGRVPFAGTTAVDRAAGSSTTNECPYMLRAAVVDDIRPQPYPVTFTYALVGNGQRVTIPPMAKAWHAVPAVPGPYDVGTNVRLIRTAQVRARWDYPFNPTSLDGNMPGSMGQHGPTALQPSGVADAFLVITDPGERDSVVWFDIAV